MPSEAESNPYSVGIYTCSKLKLDSLFLRWFSLPETQDLVRKFDSAEDLDLALVLRLLEDLKVGRPLASSNSPSLKRIMTQNNVHSATPPISPRKATMQSRSESLQPINCWTVDTTSSHLTAQTKREKVLSEYKNRIPRFYYPQEQLVLSDEMGLKEKVFDFVKPFGEGLPLVALKTLLRELFCLPVSASFALHKKLSSFSENMLPVFKLLKWFEDSNFFFSSHQKRIFDILRPADRDFLTPEDLRPVILGIIVSHPGLKFLKGASEFQERYAETVIYRIFYSLNSSGAKRISLRDVKRGGLLEALLEVEAEEDVNLCTRFFSYEHFYVIYCKFWDLDTDHDFLLSRDDLLRYGNHSLTYRIADRLFAGAARSLSSGVPNKMGYEDFVWFILSEEDKSSNSSLEYWFRACDLNGDEMLTQDELLWFYEEQLSRMECLSQETVTFEDVMSQMVDMMNPEHASCFTMRDLKKSRQLAGILFNVLFNLTKFVAFEMRDPFTMRQEREDAASGSSEWDRFARNEYMRLAAEDDVEVLME